MIDEGCIGSAALAACLEKDHIVTALVRCPSKLPEAVQSHPRLHVVKGDTTSHPSLVNIIREQDAVIQAAAYGCEGPHGLADLETDFQSIVGAAQEAQAWRREQPIRLWVLSGQALTDVPEKNSGIESKVVPIHPKYYKNYAFLRQEAQDVNWSLLCPGRIEMEEVRVLLYEFR